MLLVQLYSAMPDVDPVATAPALPDEVVTEGNRVLDWSELVREVAVCTLF